MPDIDPTPGDSAAHAADDTHLHLTSEAVKVLAHPLRSRVLTTLRRDGPATATDIAAQLRSNTGATSYHLRRLESVGLVEDTGGGVGKQRVWRAATRSHGWTNSEFAGDEDAATAAGWLVRDYHRLFDTEYGRWLDVADAWPAQWQDAAGMSDTSVQVTPERLGELQAELERVLRRYRNVDDEDPRSRRIHVWSFAYPTDVEDVPDVDVPDSDASLDSEPEA